MRDPALPVRDAPDLDVSDSGQGFGRSRLRWTDSISEAAAAVGRRPMRTLLTALGTILGVGAFVTTAGLAQTARAQVSARFDALAATEVRVQDAAPDGTNPFPDDVDVALEALNGVNHAGLMFTVPGNGAIQARNTATRPRGATGASIPVIAATPGAVDASRPTLLTGRTYDRWHELRGERVTLLGRVAANQLGITRVDHRPVVFLDDTAYTVVGIIDDVARNPDLLLAVTIPVHTANGQLDTRSVERQVSAHPRAARRRRGGSVFGGTLRGGSSASRRVVIAVISATARSNGSSVAADSDCTPLILRTYWRAPASISSGVAAGSSPRSVVMLRHMGFSFVLPGQPARRSASSGRSFMYAAA